MSIAIDDFRRKLVELSESSSNTTCSTATSDSGLADAGVGRTSRDDLGLLPGFGAVTPGLFRSSYPRQEDYGFIKTLGLKTIVTLVDKEAPEGYHAFLALNNIRHVIIDMKGTKKQSIPTETMRQILNVVLDRENYPLLVHCNQGRHRTGCVVAVLRKAFGMRLDDILSEYRDYAEPKPRDVDVEYITDFDVAQIQDLVPLPATFKRQPTFWKYVLFVLVVFAIWGLTAYRSVRDHPRRQIRLTETRSNIATHGLKVQA